MFINKRHKQDIWNHLFYENFLGYQCVQPFWQKIAGSFTDKWPSVDDFNLLAKDMPFGFILQNRDTQYEREAYLFNRIPMREASWHDFFNNLSWLIWPNLKRVIMERIGQEPSVAISKSRTPLQNFLTHFDECGIIICSHRSEVFQYIQQFQWQRLFYDTKDLTTTSEIIIFGHGLLEKALKPYIGMTGKALLLEVDLAFFDLPYEIKMDYVDKKIAQYLRDDNFCHSPRSLNPFPLLGWPGFWPGNDSPSFFLNKEYFRDGRLKG